MNKARRLLDGRRELGQSILVWLGAAAVGQGQALVARTRGHTGAAGQVAEGDLAQGANRPERTGQFSSVQGSRSVVSQLFATP